MSDQSIEQMKLDFVTDASESIDRLSQKLAGLERSGQDPKHLIDTLFRTAHSLRGTAGMFGLGEASRAAGLFENLLEAVRSGNVEVDTEVVDLLVEALDHLAVLLRGDDSEDGAGGTLKALSVEARIQGLLAAPRKARAAGAETTVALATVVEKALDGKPVSLSVKVDLPLLDSIMNSVSELFSARLALSGIAGRLPRSSATRKLRDDLLKVSMLLSKRMLDLQASVVEARLVPVSMLYDHFNGEVRRLARQAGKNIDLVCEGETTRIDRALLDNLYNPLLHVIRNAVSHGIESSEERASQGKPPRGTIQLRAQQEAAHIRIDVEDDGRGIDLDKVKAVARAKGLAIDDGESAIEILFRPGFTTKEARDEISGRGVGLDAVREEIEAIKGMVSIHTEVTKGTRFSIWVPLTLAVSRGMLIEEGGVAVAVPLGCVVEVLRLTRGLREQIERTGRIEYRGSAIATISLAEMLMTTPRKDPKSVVVVGIGDRRRAVLVEHVKGETEIVSRPLPEAMTVPSFLTGATELHDGRPAVVLQPEGLLKLVHQTGWRLRAPRRPTQPKAPVLEVGPGRTLRLAIFRRGGETYAVALGILSEVVPAGPVGQLAVVGDPWEGLFFVRGLCHGLLSLPRGSAGRRAGNARIITFKYPERCGILADETFGDYEIPVRNLTPDPAGPSSALISCFGTVVWEGRTITVVDVGHALQALFANGRCPGRPVGVGLGAENS